jgi:hypothetical protein
MGAREAAHLKIASQSKIDSAFGLIAKVIWSEQPP